jgi:nitroreductase
MDALEMLQNRVSAPVLMEPAPTQEQLQEMLKAARRAPDHDNLVPWRFLVIEGEARNELAKLYLKAGKAANPDLPEDKEAKLLKMPLRAPTLLVAIATVHDHPKVPEVEQVITAGCAAHAVVQAAYTMGLGAMWRTGEMAFNDTVKAGLGLKANEQIVGFIYLGSVKRFRTLEEESLDGLMTAWTGA